MTSPRGKIDATGEQLSREDALIASLAGCLPLPRRTRLAIGDDAAAIELPDGELLLVTTDLLMEDVHFRLRWGDLPTVGWKALAQNLSDIAAMGGAPTHAVVALAVPPHWEDEQAIALYRGLAELAASAQTDIIGGDTIRSAGPLTLGITVLGRVRPREMLTRSGARPGDGLFVTGALGRAAAGLCVLDAGRPIPERLSPAVQAQLRPEPRLAAARALATSGVVTAMMDLSDGVASDLPRLCRASKAGAIVERDRLPLAPVVFDACAWLAEAGAARPSRASGSCDEPVALALTGGDDLELLLTAPGEAEETLRARIAPLPLTRIGAITPPADLVLRGPEGDAPLPRGFTHF